MNIHKTIVKSLSTLSSSVFIILGAVSCSQAQSAYSFMVEEYEYLYEIPKEVIDVCETFNNCPTIEISYLKTTNDWVTDEINKAVNKQILQLDSEKKSSDKTNVTFSNTGVIVPKSVHGALDSIAKETTGSLNGEYAHPGHMFSVKPFYQGHLGTAETKIEAFGISSYAFLGGAHGYGEYNYVLLDTIAKKQLTIADIVIDGKKDALKKLFHKEFSHWLTTEVNETDVVAYEESWAFTLSENFIFTKDGMKIVYQPYEISPYAYGMPEFTVSYDKLVDVIKPEYLTVGTSL